MSITVTEFISLDGVVQAPGGPDEDRDGDFAHGGWSGPFFDVDVMGKASGRRALRCRRPPLRAPHLAGHGRRVARPRGRSVRRPDERRPEARRHPSLGDDDMEWNTTRIPGEQAVDRIRELREGSTC